MGGSDGGKGAVCVGLFGVIFILIGTSSPDWVSYDIDTPQGDSTYSVGLFHAYLDTPEGDCSSDIDTDCVLNSDCFGADIKLLDGSDCDSLQTARSFALLSVIVGFMTWIFMVYAVFRSAGKIKFGAFFTLLIAAFAVVTIGSFSKIDWGDGVTRDWGYIIFIVGAALSLFAGLFACLVPGQAADDGYPKLLDGGSS